MIMKKYGFYDKDDELISICECVDFNEALDMCAQYNNIIALSGKVDEIYVKEIKTEEVR